MAFILDFAKLVAFDYIVFSQGLWSQVYYVPVHCKAQ